MKNLIKIIKLHMLAWLCGTAEVHYQLGNIFYVGGTLIPRNYSTAIKWYYKAAEQGHYDASYNLGCMYYYGQGVLPDYDKAVKWMRRASRCRVSLASATIEYWEKIRELCGTTINYNHNEKHEK